MRRGSSPALFQICRVNRLRTHLGMLGKEASINSINYCLALMRPECEKCTNTFSTNVLHSTKKYVRWSVGWGAWWRRRPSPLFVVLLCARVSSKRGRWPTVRTWRRVRWLCCAVVWWATRKQEHGVRTRILHLGRGHAGGKLERDVALPGSSAQPGGGEEARGDGISFKE